MKKRKILQRGRKKGNSWVNSLVLFTKKFSCFTPRPLVDFGRELLSREFVIQHIHHAWTVGEVAYCLKDNSCQSWKHSIECVYSKVADANCEQDGFRVRSPKPSLISFFPHFLWRQTIKQGFDRESSWPHACMQMISWKSRLFQLSMSRRPLWLWNLVKKISRSSHVTC